MAKAHLSALFLALVFGGCQGLQPISKEEPYSFEKDPLAPFYREKLVSIAGQPYDSEQVSNKHLDPRMIAAIEHLNQLLGDPSSLPPELGDPLAKAGLNKITLASASRSPAHQASLKGEYLASPFGSGHLMGLAIDLEMKGKPFDVKRQGDDPEIKKVYKALGETLKLAGLFFSEPVKHDPNHVELLRWSRKSNHPDFDFVAWKEQSLRFLRALERRLSRLERDLPRGKEQRHLQRQLVDLEKRFDELEALVDPTLLGPTP